MPWPADGARVISTLDLPGGSPWVAVEQAAANLRILAGELATAALDGHQPSDLDRARLYVAIARVKQAFADAERADQPPTETRHP